MQGPSASLAGGYGAAGGGGFGSAAGILGIFGAITGAIGSFYSAKSQQSQLKSGALTAEYEASIANLNARSAELDAQTAIEAGQREAGRRSLLAGQEEGATRARIGASGTQLGVGSAAEVTASEELSNQIDALTINVNAARAAGQARMRAVSYGNQAALDRVSATNMRRTARSINPWMAAGTSLLGGASQVASQWSPRMGVGGGGGGY
jgi:hypothetical protein